MLDILFQKDSEQMKSVLFPDHNRVFPSQSVSVITAPSVELGIASALGEISGG